MKLTMITAAVCLALTALPAHGKQSRRACIREMLKTFVTDTAQAKRMCDPKNAVKPNELGWVCQVDGTPEDGPYPKYTRERGVGARYKRDAICE